MKKPLVTNGRLFFKIAVVGQRATVVRRGSFKLFKVLSQATKATDKWLGEEAKPYLGDEENRELFDVIRRGLRYVHSSYITLNSVFIEMTVCYRMVCKYPWDPKYILRSDHMHFVWSAFNNLCYVLEERMKSTVETYNMVSPVTQRTVDGSKYVKRISAELADNIRARGKFVHQNHHGSTDIFYLQAVELFQQLGEHVPKSFSVKAFGPRATRKKLREQMLHDVRKAEAVLLDFYNETVPDLVKAIEFYGRALEKENAKRGVASAYSEIGPILPGRFICAEGV